MNTAEDKLKQPAKKQKTSKKQVTLFDCKAVKKISHDRRGNTIKSDFVAEEIRDITGSEFGKGVSFICTGCGSSFMKKQGLCGHQVQ